VYGEGWGREAGIMILQDGAIQVILFQFESAIRRIQNFLFSATPQDRCQTRPFPEAHR
jgi:hypothetical protein